MHAFLVALVPYLTHPAFQITLSGVIAPFIHWMLRELGLSLSPRQNFWFNVLLSATPFLVMVTVWGAHGLPTPTDLYVGVGATVAVSQGMYKSLVKKLMDGRQDEIDIPSAASQGNA